MIKDPKKLAQRMSILCILIGFIALAVGIIAMAMEQYIIAIAMGIADSNTHHLSHETSV